MRCTFCGNDSVINLTNYQEKFEKNVGYKSPYRKVDIKDKFFCNNCTETFEGATAPLITTKSDKKKVFEFDVDFAEWEYEIVHEYKSGVFIRLFGGAENHQYYATAWKELKDKFLNMEITANHIITAELRCDQKREMKINLNPNRLRTKDET